MIVSITDENETQEIIGYIGDNKAYCLYLYANMLKYGISNPNQKVWIDKSETGIQCIFLLYYDCLHVYTSNQDYDISLINDMIIKEKPQTLFIPSYLILSSLRFVSDNYYRDEVTVFRKSDCMIDDKFDIRIASIKDIPAIVDLLLNDKEYNKIYTKEVLFRQLKERISSGYSRMYVLKDNNTIVATMSTNAELDNMAIIGGLVVDSSQRGNGYGTALMKYLQHELIEEGKEVFSVVTSEKSKSIITKLKSKIVAVVSKYYFKV